MAGSQQEIIIPADLPLVQEIGATLREWAQIWHKLFVVCVHYLSLISLSVSSTHSPDTVLCISLILTTLAHSVFFDSSERCIAISIYCTCLSDRQTRQLCSGVYSRWPTASSNIDLR